MDSNDFNYDYNKNNNQSGEPYTDAFAIASFCMGIFSIPCLCCTYLAIISGVLAIVFAIISKKRSGKMVAVAIAGMTIGIVTSILGILLTIVGIYLMQAPEYQQLYQDIINQYKIFKNNAI